MVEDIVEELKVPSPTAASSRGYSSHNFESPRKSSIFEKLVRAGGGGGEGGSWGDAGESPTKGKKKGSFPKFKISTKSGKQ